MWRVHEETGGGQRGSGRAQRAQCGCEELRTQCGLEEPSGNGFGGHDGGRGGVSDGVVGARYSAGRALGVGSSSGTACGRTAYVAAEALYADTALRLGKPEQGLGRGGGGGLDEPQRGWAVGVAVGGVHRAVGAVCAA